MRVRGEIVVAALLASSLAAADPTKKVCSDAYERAQYARRGLRLREARGLLLVCAQRSCGAAAASDCGRWLGEVEVATPSIVCAATRDAGTAPAATAVTSDDGARLAERLDGVAIPVDPGAHVFRFESAGRAPVTVPLTVREGEKSRLVSVVFPSTHPAPRVAPAPTVLVVPAAPPATRGSVWPSVTVGGVGVGLVAGSLVVGLLAKSDFDSLRATGCAPHCATSSVSPIETKAVLSDVLLGVGVAAVATGVTLLVVRSAGAPKPATAAVTWPLQF